MIRIAVFASGRGSNFQAIHQNISEGSISAQIDLLVTDQPRAGAIDYANAHHIPVSVIRPRDYASPVLYGEALAEVLGKHHIGLIVLAGFLKMIPVNIIQAYPQAILNIHPALLPSFGGAGMYGMRVHEAVFNAGVKLSGVTIHFVNEKYDDGAIILQEAVDISGCRTPQEIANRVLSLEHNAYSQAIRKVCSLPFELHGKRVIFKEKQHDCNSSGTHQLLG